MSRFPDLAVGQHRIACDDLLTLGQAAVLTGLAERYLRHLAAPRQIQVEMPTVSRWPRRRFRRSVLLSLLRHREPILPSPGDAPPQACRDLR